MKKILLIIPELSKGGAERAFSKLSVLLSAYHQVFVCVFHSRSEIVYPINGKLIDLHTPPTNSLADKLTYIFKRIRKIRRIKKDCDIDITISFLEGADYLNILSKGKDQVIVSIRGSKLHDGQISGWLGLLRKNLLIPLLYRFADMVITVSHALKNEMTRDFRLSANKVNTIPNFYPVEEITLKAKQSIPSEYESIYDLPVIINVGRLHPQKGQNALFDIYAAVRKKIPCRLLIIGEGQFEDVLYKQAISLGLKVCVSKADAEADVYLLGYQHNPFAFISKSKVFAFPSYWEGFPNALLEAMICKTLVVSADCPTGPREIIAPDTSIDSYAIEPEKTPYGWLMPLPFINKPDSMNAWVEVIVGALNEQDHMQIEAASLHAHTYSEEKVGQLWLKLISK